MHILHPKGYILLCLLPIQVVALLDILSGHPAGTVFTFEDRPFIQYLAASQPILKIQHTKPSIAEDTNFQVLTPATSIWIQDSHITPKSIESQLNLYGRGDDVWNDNFLKYLVIIYENQHDSHARFGSNTYAWLKSIGITRIFVSGSIQAEEIIPTYVLTGRVPPGPLLISRSETIATEVTFHEVYRLYLDEYDAFIFGAIPDLVHGGWILTNITRVFEDGSYSQLIPVPSRVVTSPGPNLPLTSTRFGLKDIYDAQGLPTAAGSKAYELTHPIPTHTAPSIEKLLALGATMIGKTRTSQFAHGAQPWEFVDVPYSWNPRADGHLTASASSSGSACAIAAYDWLEFTVGSDTRGSVRKPASLVGAYGIRPSHGSVDLTGVVPLSEEMDTAGFFTRHPGLFYLIATRWYAESPVASKVEIIRFPSKLIYPMEHFPVKNQEAQDIIDGFVRALEDHLAIEQVRVDFTEVLSPFLPNGSFPLFQLSSNKLAEYRSWIDVGRPITKKFMSRYGKAPMFDPIPEKMFKRALLISDQDFVEAVALKRAFRDSLAEHIFKHDDESCSDSLFIYDAATGGLPSYRVEEFNHISGAIPFLLTAAGAEKEAKLSDFFNFLASMGELPEITIPIGQARYYSPVSRKLEYIPVAIELVTRKGCDQMLLDLVRTLAETGIIRAVKVGRSTF